MVTPPPGPIGSLGDLEQRAERQAPPDVWAYVQGGSGEERTLRSNRAALLRHRLRPRVLRGLTHLETGVTLLGASLRAPFYIAPMAYHGDLHPEGEIAAARAAAGAGVLAIFSTLSSRPLEEIAQAAPGGTRWFQLYRQPAWAQSEELVRRAERAGYAAIVLTADVPVLAVRDRQAAGGFAIDSGRTLGNGPHIRTPPRSPEGSGGVYRIRPDDGGDWSVVDRLRETTELPVLVKGILHPDDATVAVAHGAKGIIVSNHGGRQLDGALPAIDALPAVVAAVGGRAEVLVEGGFRRAADLLVARALGARAIGIGRPILWSLLLGGTAGIAEYLRLLEAELANAMALCGVATMEEVDARLLSTEPTTGPRPRT